MTLQIHSTGDFDLELYGYQTDVPEHEIRDILSDLNGFDRSWTITLHDPDENDPDGRITIQHTSFNDYTTIEIASRLQHGGTGSGVTYDVYNPMETDILTHAEDVTLQEALRTAVDVANTERKRHSKLLPPYTLSVPNALKRVR